MYGFSAFNAAIFFCPYTPEGKNKEINIIKLKIIFFIMIFYLSCHNTARYLWGRQKVPFRPIKNPPLYIGGGF